MENEKEIVKIKTRKGMIITLTVQGRTPTHIYGWDLYGADVILNLKDIDTMIPIKGGIL